MTSGTPARSGGHDWGARDVPTLVLHGASDFVNQPDSSAGKERLFAGAYRRVLLDGA